MTHINLVRSLFDKSATLQSKPIILNGHDLDIAAVVACARHGAKVEISKDPAVLQGLEDSLNLLKSKAGKSIYGISTGFGGSASTRTNHAEELQVSLIEHQLCGFLPIKGDSFTSRMPEEIVRAAMIIRINSLLRGHSAIRLHVLENAVKFLNLGITPVVPLRTSISASGDLSPLAYIAASLCGHPDIRVIDRSSGEPVIMPCREALKKHNMDTILLGPKEGLALINGTAYSAGAAALAMHDTHYLALLSQACTALTVEAEVGMQGSFDTFISNICRPHPGQIETAANITAALSSSHLAVPEEVELDCDADSGVLRQDRYPLRTSPQFVGPNLETLILASQQVSIELNTTTDNPLIDVKGGKIHHGGNFMAMSPAVAMENTRSTIQLLGKLAFAQTTELLNCTMNRGLPSCLAGDDPSTNYMSKGLDIACAAYTAELGFLSASQTAHFQSAEMHNQAVNSMALASARRTIEANEVFTLLLASQLYACCQAVDLRVMDLAFRIKLQEVVADRLASHFSIPKEKLAVVTLTTCEQIYTRLDQTTSTDLVPRMQDVFRFASGHLLHDLSQLTTDQVSVIGLKQWADEGAESAISIYKDVRNRLFEGKLTAEKHLGKTVHLYRFVRETCGVSARRGDVASGAWGETIGTAVSRVVEGLNTVEGRKAILATFA